MNIFYKSTRRLFARNFKVNMEKYIPNYKQIVSKEKELKDKVNDFLSSKSNKEEILQKLKEFRKQYPSQDLVVKAALEEKKKTNPQATLDDLTEDDVNKLIDPDLVNITKEFNLTQDESLDVGPSEYENLPNNQLNNLNQIKINEDIKDIKKLREVIFSESSSIPPQEKSKPKDKEQVKVKETKKNDKKKENKKNKKK